MAHSLHLVVLIGTRYRFTRANQRAGAPSGRGGDIALSALLLSRPVIVLDRGSNFEIIS